MKTYEPLCAASFHVADKKKRREIKKEKKNPLQSVILVIYYLNDKLLKG